MPTRVPFGRVSSVWRIVATLLLAGPLAAQYTIQTLSGGAIPSGVAAATVALRPQSITIDGAGNAYFSTGSIVFKVAASTGVLTPVAGNGLPGYAGDGGLATASQLNGAMDVAVDSAGNLYIADTGNNVVRRVSTAGLISTFAGTGAAGYSGDSGSAATAQMRAPAGVALDPSGLNVYISDTQNNVVRKVSGGVITTFAGNGSGGFNGDNLLATSANLYQPLGLAVDAAGSVYIADRLNQRVRKVSAGQITTVAGSGTAGSLGDGGTATVARLNGPYGIAVDAAGTLYIADHDNGIIRRVSTAGVISTVAGTAPGVTPDPGLATLAQLNGPQRVAVDGVGNFYIADTLNNRVRKVSAGTITTLSAGASGDSATATNALWLSPTSVAVDTAGNYYVADSANHRVKKITRNGGVVTIAGTGTPGLSGDGGAAISARLWAPAGVALDSQNNLYIADSGNNVVRKVTSSTGVISTVAGDGTPATLRNPLGIALDAAGTLYIADTYNHAVRKLQKGTLSTVAGRGTAGYSGDGGPALTAQLTLPTALAVDANGNLFVADSGNSTIRKIDPAGNITTAAGTGPAASGYGGDGAQATAARLNIPRGVATDASNQVYIADTGNNRIRRIAVDGTITSIAGGGPSGSLGDGGNATSAALVSPQGLAVDRSQFVSIAETGTSRVRLLTMSTIPITVDTNPTGLTVAVDAVSYTAPASFNWVAGSLHTLAVSSPQNGQTLVSWNDGLAASHTVATPSTTASYVAAFTAAAAGCQFAITPLSQTVTAPAGSGTVAVSANSASCNYSAISNSSFLSVTSQTAGTVTYAYSANTGAGRTGTLSIAGQTVTVTQLASVTAGAPLSVQPGIFRGSGAGGVLWVRDRNGDGVFTGSPDTALPIGVLGTAGDLPIMGDWNGSGTAKLGIYRPSSSTAPGTGLFVLDSNGDEQFTAADKALWFAPQAGDVPVVGRWNGGPADRVGIFRNGTWYLDVNGNGTFSQVVNLGQPGDVPVVGDWNGSGTTKVGVFRNGLWILDYNGNGQWDGPSIDKFFYLGQPGDTPLIGDWNGSGTAKAGLYRSGLWVLDYNGNGQWDGMGVDKALFNGTAGDTPILGNWTGDGKTKAGVFHQGTWFFDVLGDGSFSRLGFLGQSGDTPIAGKW